MCGPAQRTQWALYLSLSQSSGRLDIEEWRSGDIGGPCFAEHSGSCSSRSSSALVVFLHLRSATALGFPPSPPPSCSWHFVGVRRLSQGPRTKRGGVTMLWFRGLMLSRMWTGRSGYLAYAAHGRVLQPCQVRSAVQRQVAARKTGFLAH